MVAKIQVKVPKKIRDSASQAWRNEEFRLWNGRARYAKSVPAWSVSRESTESNGSIESNRSIPSIHSIRSIAIVLPNAGKNERSLGGEGLLPVHEDGAGIEVVVEDDEVGGATRFDFSDVLEAE